MNTKCDSFEIAILMYISVIVVHYAFLGAFVKLRKATIIFVMFVCLPIRLYVWNDSALMGRSFTKFDMRVFSENLSSVFSIN